MRLRRRTESGRTGCVLPAVAGALFMWCYPLPAAAFPPPPRDSGVASPIPAEIDRMLYCSQVAADASSVQDDFKMARGLLGASFLFEEQSFAALTGAGWTFEEIQQRILPDYPRRVASDRETGRLLYREEQCLSLAADSPPADLPPYVLELLDCAMLFELEGGDTAPAATEDLHRISTTLFERAADKLDGVGFSGQAAADIANSHATLVWAQVASGRPPRPMEFCMALLDRSGEAD